MGVIHFALVEIPWPRQYERACRIGLEAGRLMADNRLYQPAQLAAAVIIGVLAALIIVILYRGISL